MLLTLRKESFKVPGVKVSIYRELKKRAILIEEIHKLIGMFLIYPISESELGTIQRY